MNKKAQQEIVGFVLIVVLVIVGLMVYLVISLRESPVEKTNIQAGNILDSIMKMTTECAVIFEPDFDNYGELFGSCYSGETCRNLNKKACEYLNESLKDVLDDLMKSEATINYYKFELFEKDGEGILEIKWGNCTGKILGAQRNIFKDSQNLITRITLCNN
jgi:hypothetical protein